MNTQTPIPILAVVGWKNSGKTDLVVRLIRALLSQGLRVSTVKHAHHQIDMDQPGRDSWRHREAGAHEAVVVTATRFVLQQELRGRDQLSLGEISERLEPVDLLLAEGFKGENVPKIETWREVCGQAPLAIRDGDIFAIAVKGGKSALAKQYADLCTRMPVLELGDSAAILAVILERFDLKVAS